MASVFIKRFHPSSFLLPPSNAWQPLWFLVTAVCLGLALGWAPLPLAGGLVVGTAVLLLIFVRPLLGVGLTLLFGPLGALENLLFGGGLLDSGQTMLLITLAAWIGRGLLRRRIHLPHTFLNVPLLLLLYVAAFTLPGAPSLESGIKELLKWAQIGLVMLLITDYGVTVHSPPANPPGGSRVRWNLTHLSLREGERTTHYALRTTLFILLLAGLSQALVGVWQFGLRGTGPEHFLIFGRFYRAYGTFEQPNPFGGFMNLTALLASGSFAGFILAFWQNRRAKDVEPHPLTPSPLLLTGVCAIVATLALVFSWSRGAWLGFVAGTAVLLLFFPRKRWQGVALLGAVVVLSGLLLFAGVQLGRISPAVVDRISGFSQDLRFGDARGVDINDDNYAILERLAHWQAALDMARDHIWLGVGFGNYEPAYAGYALINWPYPLGHAHNYYLNLLAEVGVLGLAAYLVFWTAVILQTIRQLKQLDWPHRGIALGLLAAWAALSVHHLVDKLYVNNIYIHLGVMLGLLQLLDKETTRPRDHETTRLRDYETK